MKIYKYPLNTEVAVIELPGEAKIISAAVQHDNIVLYAMVEDGKPNETKAFARVFGTGQPIAPEDIDGYEFLGTVMLHRGILVFHVFVKVMHIPTKEALE